ncbi:MAG: citrate/2-methylcitrate synthase [Candidatus Methylacidiphilales bacterium]
MAVIAKGLEGVIAAETSLSDVRGTEGVLVYRGYNIDELAGKICFEEAAYLLWHGHLPRQNELNRLRSELAFERELPKGVVDFISNAPRDAVPMDVIRTAVSMLGLHDPGMLAEEEKAGLQLRRAISITAKMGVITAMFHRVRTRQPLLPIRTDLGEAAHFLYLLNGYPPSSEMEKTLDLAFVLHADHGMNASTFSARVTIATLTDMYSAVTSAIGTLKGPLHGGANEGVIRMLQEIGEESQVDAWVQEQLDQKRKIMGIGHRIYKVLDPRAPHLKKMAVALTRELGEPKWIRMSERIAELMLEKKGLHANVDFYSATVYHSLNIPIDLFTPLFAIARTAGWTAHILEQLADNRLYRPESEYTGPAEGRTVSPIGSR